MSKHDDKFQENFENYKAYVHLNKIGFGAGNGLPENAKSKRGTQLVSWRNHIIRNGSNERKEALLEFDNTYRKKYQQEYEINREFQNHLQSVYDKKRPSSLEEYLKDENYLNYGVYVYLQIRKIYGVPILTNPGIVSLILAIYWNKKDKLKSLKEYYEIHGSVEEVLDEVLSTLTEQEERVLRLRFGLNESGKYLRLREIGDIMKLSQNRIRQIEEKALRKMRNPRRLRKLLVGYDPTKDPHSPEYNDKRIMDDPEADVKKGITIEEMGLTTLARNRLYSSGKRTIQDILDMNASDIIQIRSFGRGSMIVLMERMEYFGFKEWVDKVEREYQRKYIK